MYYPNKLDAIIKGGIKDFSFCFNLSHGRLYYSEPYLKHGHSFKSTFLHLEQDLTHFYNVEFEYLILNVIRRTRRSMIGNNKDDKITLRFQLPGGIFNKEIVFDIIINRMSQIDNTRFLYSNKKPLDLGVTDYLIENNYFSLEELNRDVVDEYLIDNNLIIFGDEGLINIKKRKTRFMLNAKTYFLTKILPQNLFGIITYINLLLHVISESFNLVLNKNEVYFNNIKDYGIVKLNQYKNDKTYRLILNPELKNPLDFKSNELYLYGVNDGKRVF